MTDAMQQQLLNSTLATTSTPLISTDLQNLNLPENYSVLIDKLERLALGLDAAFSNLSLDHKEVEIAVTNGATNGATHAVHVVPDSVLWNSNNAPPPFMPQHPRHAGFGNVAGGEGMEISRVVSDIWIGVILTLLIVSVIFFICSCFLYHKFQQWKHSYHGNQNEPVEICRRCPGDFEAESLPSYTIVSGLPTYDDALEEFRKAGIILTPSMPMIKLFDNGGNNAANNTKENMFDCSNANNNDDGDNISITSTCTCGGGGGGQNNNQNNSTANITNNSNASLSASALLLAAAAQQQQQQQQQQNGQQIIELNPEQLEQLSKKRLSLQIAFNSPVAARRGSRPRIDLYREVNRNNLLRSSRAYGGAGGCGSGSGAPRSPEIIFPPIHRSSSSISLSSNVNERNLFDRRLSHLQHRGSLC